MPFTHRFQPLLLGAVALALVAACAPVVAPPPTSTSTPVPAPAAPPILTEAQAKERGTHFAAASRPELSPGQNVRNPRARLMTLAEYEGRFLGGRSVRDGSRPVWVVVVEGEWRDDGIVPPEYRQTYRYGAVGLDAHTGAYLGSSHGTEPPPLEEAEGLDPAAFPTYPLEVPLPYAAEVGGFPVLEPQSLPQGFSLRRVVLDFANPLPEALPSPWLATRVVVLRYADQGGHTLDLVRYEGGLPDVVEGATRVPVQGTMGWRGDAPGGAAWLAWQTTYLGTHVVHVLRSASGSVPGDALLQVAESLPTPTSGAAPTPRPTSTPAASPYLTPTLTPTPTPHLRPLVGRAALRPWRGGGRGLPLHPPHPLRRP